MAKLQAISDYVIVEPITNLDAEQQDTKEKLEKLGLVSAQVKKPQGAPNRGKVVSIGENIKEPGYSEGDIVIFIVPSPQGFKFDGVGYIPVHKDHVVGILTE